MIRITTLTRSFRFGWQDIRNVQLTPLLLVLLLQLSMARREVVEPRFGSALDGQQIVLSTILSVE